VACDGQLLVLWLHAGYKSPVAHERKNSESCFLDPRFTLWTPVHTVQYLYKRPVSFTVALNKYTLHVRTLYGGTRRPWSHLEEDTDGRVLYKYTRRQ
jgi:hypothetical protein